MKRVSILVIGMLSISAMYGAESAQVRPLLECAAEIEGWSTGLVSLDSDLVLVVDNGVYVVNPNFAERLELFPELDTKPSDLKTFNLAVPYTSLENVEKRGYYYFSVSRNAFRSPPRFVPGPFQSRPNFSSDDSHGYATRNSKDSAADFQLTKLIGVCRNDNFKSCTNHLWRQTSLQRFVLRPPNKSQHREY